jgi:hypothetical protein
MLSADAKRLAGLVADLNHDEFAVREKATDELEKLGRVAEPALRQALTEMPPLEARRRIERILGKLPGTVPWPVERLRVLRAIDALEKMGTAEARRVLEGIAKGAPDAGLVADAQGSLDRLARR